MIGKVISNDKILDLNALRELIGMKEPHGDLSQNGNISIEDDDVL